MCDDDHVGNANGRRGSETDLKQLTGIDIFIEEMIGEGKFGQIYRATTTFLNTSPSPRVVVAIKCITKPTESHKHRESTLRKIHHEVSIQKHVRHPHILPIYGFCDDSVHMLLIMEFAPLGDAQAYLKRTNFSCMDERIEIARNILWQTCQAVSHLATVRVAHRDIKSETHPKINNSSNPKLDLWVKLCDFGSAVYVKPGQRQSTLCGTPEYVAPEMLPLLPLPNEYRLAARYGATDAISYVAEYVDRWMLGVLALDLVDDTTPFRPSEYEIDTLDDDEICESIFTKIRSFSGSIQCSTDNALHRDLVAQFLRVEPTDRLSPKNTLMHSYFRGLSLNHM